jgi:hypothetical protein
VSPLLKIPTGIRVYYQPVLENRKRLLASLLQRWWNLYLYLHVSWLWSIVEWAAIHYIDITISSAYNIHTTIDTFVPVSGLFFCFKQIFTVCYNKDISERRQWQAYNYDRSTLDYSPIMSGSRSTQSTQRQSVNGWNRSPPIVLFVFAMRMNTISDNNNRMYQHTLPLSHHERMEWISALRQITYFPTTLKL